MNKKFVYFPLYEEPQCIMFISHIGKNGKIWAFFFDDVKSRLSPFPKDHLTFWRKKHRMTFL